MWDVFNAGVYWGANPNSSHRLSMGGGNLKRPEDVDIEEIPLRRQDSFRTP
jgi:hypothetical protein